MRKSDDVSVTQELNEFNGTLAPGTSERRAMHDGVVHLVGRP